MPVTRFIVSWLVGVARSRCRNKIIKPSVFLVPTVSSFILSFLSLSISRIYIRTTKSGFTTRFMWKYRVYFNFILPVYIQTNPIESSWIVALFRTPLDFESNPTPTNEALTDSEKGISFSSRYKGVVNEFKLVITASRRKCTQWRVQ